MPRWVQRWGSSLDPRPVAQGVFRCQHGGFLVRMRVKVPGAATPKEFKKVLRNADLPTALRVLHDGVQALRRGMRFVPPQRTSFTDFAVSLFEEKITKRRINSAKTREKWEHVLRLHLVPTFGELPVNEPIPPEAIDNWLFRSSKTRSDGQIYSPTTVNGWLAVLSVIVNAAARRFRWPWNPMQDIEPLDTSTHHTYTEEEPNSLTALELGTFLSAMRQNFPQHFGMVALGFATGWRPSTLRPIRRRGAQADVLWEEGIILVRRSHSMRQEVMEKTKQGTRYRVSMPTEVMDILRWHVDSLPTGRMRDSDLLFPSTTGGLRASSVLLQPFLDVAEAVGLRKRITPRAMRRTFQDLARAADVKDIVTRSVSGHSDEKMQYHYSTVAQEEIRQALGRVVALAGYERLLPAASSGVDVVRRANEPPASE